MDMDAIEKKTLATRDQRKQYQKVADKDEKRQQKILEDKLSSQNVKKTFNQRQGR